MEKESVAWWNPAYGKRIQVNITAPSDYTDEFVEFVLNTSLITYSSLLPSGEDIAVVDANGNLMNFTVHSWSSSECLVGVEVTIPAAQTIPLWVYYNSTSPVSIGLKNNTNFFSEPWSDPTDLNAWETIITNGSFAVESLNSRLSYLNQTLQTENTPSRQYAVAVLNVSRNLKTLAWELNATIPDNSFVSLNLNFSDGSLLRYLCMKSGNYTDADIYNGTGMVYYRNLTGTPVEHEGIEFLRFEVANLSSDVESAGISSELTRISIEFATTNSSSAAYTVLWNSISGCVERKVATIDYGVEESIAGPILSVFIPEDNISFGGENLIFAGSSQPVYSNISKLEVISDTTTTAVLLPEGLWYAFVNLSGYAEGPHQFEVRATDETGVSTSKFLNVTKVSGTTPSISIGYPANNTKVNGTENCTGNFANANSVSLKVNNGSWQNAEMNTTAWWYSYNFSQLPHGKYFLFARASTAGAVIEYAFSIVSHGAAPTILNFNVVPVSQVSDNDTFSGWANITSPIGFTSYLQYALNPSFTSPTELPMGYIAGNTYFAQLTEKFNTLTTVYFRVKVVDIDNYMKYSSSIQRTVDTSYATGNIQLLSPPDTSVGVSILVNSSTIFNTFGSPVINGTLFMVWAEQGNINYIPGPSQVTSVNGKISFYYTGTTPGSDIIHVQAVVGNATGMAMINVHPQPAIAECTPTSNLSVPSATISVRFTTPMDPNTITTSNITSSHGTITGITIINETSINIQIGNLSYNRTFIINFNLRDIFGGVLNQGVQFSTAYIGGTVVLIPQTWIVDAGSSIMVNSSIIHDTAGNIIQDGTEFSVRTTLGWINTVGSRNATVFSAGGKISFNLIGENVIGSANITVEVNTTLGNANGHTEIQFADLVAPMQPKNLAVTPSTWTNINNFILTWENPESLTPICRAHYKFGTPPTSNTDYNGFEEGVNISTMEISVPAQGIWNVYIWLSDAANNTDYTKHAHVTVYLDASPPAISSIDIPQLTSSQQITATINAQDTLSGIAGYYWRFYRNGSAPPAYTYSTTNIFQLTFSVEGGYTFECYAVDNVGISSEVVSACVFYDAGNPYGNITIAGKPFTSKRQLVLHLNASDNVSGVEKMMLSINDPNFGNSTWVNFSTTHTVILTGPDGTYRIYVKFRDYVGHESAVSYDDITLDTTPPYNCTAIVDGGAKYTNKTTVNVSIGAMDALSGVSGFYISWVENENGTWYPFTPNLTLSLSNTTEGLHVLFLKIFDSAGNFVLLTVSISYDVTLPVLRINGPQYTNSTVISLNLEASDNIGNIRFVRFSEQEETLGSVPWEDFSTSLQFIISEGDGERSIYAQVCTDLGEVSEVTNVTFILDTISPGLILHGLAGGGPLLLTNNTTYNLTWSASDTNGIAETILYIKYGESDVWEELARVSQNYYLLTLEDNKTYGVKIVVIDPAGNSMHREIQVIVNINYPPVYVDASIPLQVFTDTICKFSVNFTDPKNETLSYTWYLNGNVTGQGNTIEHVFRNPGTYTLKVVVTDGVHTVECSWNITVNQKVEAKGIGDFLPWLIPTALIILLVVVVVTLMRRKEKEAVRKPPAEEGGVVAESPGIPEEVHVEEEEAEYGITPEIEKKIKAYVKQNPGIYLTKLASDIAAEHGMREVDVITAVQMMEVDGDLTLQVDEEGKTRVYPP
ncbi:MAG: PKD domain-containing protein [Thermoplasmata archaeon]